MFHIPNSKTHPVFCTKHLGVEIDSRLSWSNHIDKICKKVSSGIGIIEKARLFVNFNTLDTLYKSLVQYHFDYCGHVWDAVGKTLSDKLQGLQNRAARVITASSYDTRSEALRQHLCWDDLQTRHLKQVTTMMFQVHHGLCPEYLTDMFIKCSQSTSYSLRSASNNNYFIPRPRCEYLKTSFSYMNRGAYLWNHLSKDAKITSSLHSFKASLLPSDFFPHKFLIIS